VDAALCPDALRDVLVHVHAAARGSKVSGAGEQQDQESPLEHAARILREQILAEFLARGLPDESSSGVIGTGVATAQSAIAAPVEDGSGERAPVGPVSVSLMWQDPAEQPLRTRVVEVEVTDGDSKWTDLELGCPQCRRPIDLGIWLEPFQQPSSQQPEPQSVDAGGGKDKHAYVAFLCDGGKAQFLQALILGQSLITAGCTKDRVLFYSPSVPSPYLEVLSQVWGLRPLKSWPRVWNRRSPLNERIVRLRALELTDFAKVLVLELGLVFRSCADSIFELDCPAAVLHPATPEGAPQRLDMSVLLLEPSSAALQRMANEIFGDSAAWPPRTASTPSTMSAGEENRARPSDAEEYVRRFYCAFFSGSWRELPNEYAPFKIEGPMPAAALEVAVCSLPSRSNVWTEALELCQHKQSAGGAAAWAASELRAVEEKWAPGAGIGLLAMVQKVERKRCVTCHVYDRDCGVEDPIDCRWRCRFCWEELLLDASFEVGNLLPLPATELEELKKQLRDWFTGSGRQRWNLEIERSRGWIEFRPKGVLWTSNSGVGFWKAWFGDRGSPQLELHICQAGRPETRHVLQPVKSEDSWPGFILEEVRRENFKPLGFARKHLERRARAWPCTTPQALPRQPRPEVAPPRSRAPAPRDATSVASDAPAGALSARQPEDRPPPPPQRAAPGDEPPSPPPQRAAPTNGSSEAAPKKAAAPDSAGKEETKGPPARSKLSYLF